MITLQEVLYIHEQFINQFGGCFGFRDKGLIESLLEKPYMTFNNIELYPNEKASSVLESIIKNCPFIDGNKRTGYTLMRYFLLKMAKTLKQVKKKNICL